MSHIHFHYHFPGSEFVAELEKIRASLDQLKGTIMATQSEIVEQLKAAAARQAKTRDEIKVVQGTVTELNAKVAELQAAVANSANASPELVAAAQAVADLAQQTDDQLPDVSGPPVIPPVEPI